MPRILLLLPTTTYRAQAFLDAALGLGVQVTVGSEDPSTVSKLNPSGFLTLDFTNPAQAARRVVEFARRHPIDAVVPVDDQVTVAAATISQALGLRSNSVESARAARNKYRMRELLAKAAVPQPSYRLCVLDGDARAIAGADTLRRLAEMSRETRYPCVLKPLMLSGSRGVIRANEPGEFTHAALRLIRILQRESGLPGAGDSQPPCDTRRAGVPASGPAKALEQARADARCEPAAHCSMNAESEPMLAASSGPRRWEFLVEQFVSGREVALEGLLSRGRLRVLALFDKPDPLDGPFFPETIYVTPSRLPERLQDAIARRAEQAAQAIGLSEGPVHTELRVAEAAVAERSPGDQVSVIELNGRSIGGFCSRVLRFGAGVSLEELIIRHGLDEHYTPPDRERRPAGVMMIPIPRAGTLREVRGVEHAEAVAHVERVQISVHPGQQLAPLPEGGHYLGFIFAYADSPGRVEAALRQAHERLEFVIEPDR